MTAATRRVLIVVAVVFAVVGLAVNLWRPVAPALPAGTPAVATFPEPALGVVRAYAEPRYLGALAALLLTTAVPLLAVLTPAGRRIVTWLAGAEDLARWRSAARVVGGITLAAGLARLPVDVVVGYVRERNWGFRTDSIWGFLRDVALELGLTVGIAVVAALVLLAAVRRWPDAWHWIAVPAVTAFAAGLVLLFPLVVQPLFLATSPLEDGPVQAAVDEVLVAAGEEGLGVEVADASRRTTRANAFVTGLGPTRRVVLFDTLASQAPDRVAATVAHELAHREHRDVPRGVLLTAAGALPVLWVLHRAWGSAWVRARLHPRRHDDPRLLAVALAIVTLGQVVGQPAAMWFSRRAEAAADHRGLELAPAARPLIELERSFVLRDLANPDPPTWVTILWGSHPGVTERIRAAAPFAPELTCDDVGPPREEWHPRVPVGSAGCASSG